MLYASGVTARPFAGKRTGQYCSLLRLTNIAWGKNSSFNSENYFVLFILLIKKLNAELKQLFYTMQSVSFRKIVCPVLFMVLGLAATLLTHVFEMTSYCDVIMPN